MSQPLDIEKQTSPGVSSTDPEIEEREHVDLSSSDEEENSEKKQHQRQASTKFAPMKQPEYRGANDGKEGNLVASRTFSRRAPTFGDETAHPFGGTLSHSRAEAALERFLSQKPNLEKGEPIIVHWEGDDDPENPLNWSFAYKCWLTVLAATLVLNSTFTSSAPNGVTPQLISYFGFSQEVATLSLSIWVAGYCLGPLIFGPLSERLGRKPVFVVSILFYTGFNVGCALSKNTASILVFRFLGGVFGAAPLTNSGGCIADVWNAKSRGIAMSLFSIAPFAGPAVSPIISGAIQVTGTDWRWMFWVCAIFSGVCLILVIFTLKESYAPVILQRKAQRIRKETGQDYYKSPLDMHPLVAKHLLHDTLLFPFVMLVQEPILLAMALYLGFVYGIIYLLFGAYPIIYEEVHGFNALITGIMFLPLFLGGVVGVLVYILIFNPRYVRKMEEYAKEGKGRVPPEERLLIVCVAAPCLVISFFWIGWTHYKSISFWSPMIGGSLLGFAILLVFLGLFNYIVDAYLAKAASGLAGNTVVRSAFGAGFPLFTAQMFKKLGVSWACSLLGFLALLLLPIPFVLVKYGPKIRAMSKHAADH